VRPNSVTTLYLDWLTHVDQKATVCQCRANGNQELCAKNQVEDNELLLVDLRKYRPERVRHEPPKNQ
jgi:hypothetical protein